MSKPLHLAAVTVLASVIAGCSIIAPPSSPAGDPGTTAPPKSMRPSASPSSRPRALSPFASLLSYLAHRDGQITAAVYDKRTGRTWVFHRGIRQDTASIVKVEIMGTALWEAQNGTPLSAAEKALLPLMIENSDNNAATEMLADVGGPSAVQRFDRRAGLFDTIPSRQKYIPGSTLPGWGLTTTTAFDEVRLVSRFAYPNSVLTTVNRQYGLNLMEHVESDQAWGVSAGNYGLLSGATVALKNGWLPHQLATNSDWQINSIGWVSGHGRDYVLAVLTDHSPTEAYGIDTIDTIARSIYTELGAGSGGSS
ncbi:MAG TPA: serine hydrolase [Streptosporangiaceae bacterium]|nr:serine hydrolase [Streptosporangiaceae bacterium]